MQVCTLHVTVVGGYIHVYKCGQASLWQGFPDAPSHALEVMCVTYLGEIWGQYGALQSICSEASSQGTKSVPCSAGCLCLS